MFYRNDEQDIEAETISANGETVRNEKGSHHGGLTESEKRFLTLDPVEWTRNNYPIFVRMCKCPIPEPENLPNIPYEIIEIKKLSSIPTRNNGIYQQQAQRGLLFIRPVGPGSVFRGAQRVKKVLSGRAPAFF